LPDSKSESLVKRLLTKFRYKTIDPDLFTAADALKSTSRGDPNVIPPIHDLSSAASMAMLNSAMDIMQVGNGYLDQVMACTRLSEQNIVFKGITDKLCQSISNPPTKIQISRDGKISEARATKIEYIFNDLLVRMGWEERKDTFIRRLLNEGGLSWEIVLSSSQSDQIRTVEYRPHHRIVPVLDSYGRFVDVNNAYNEVNGRGGVTASFPAWALVDYNLVDSAFHNRGIPHLATAQILLSSAGQLIRGLVQKVIRAGGSIEHYNLEDSTRAGDVDLFKKQNMEALEASPESMVRKVFSKGKVNIERLAGDASSVADTSVVSFLLDIIFFASGCPKAVVGFDSSAVVKNQADIVWQRHLDVLRFIESRLFYGLRKVFEFELLLHGIVLDDNQFHIVGGNFVSIGPVTVSKDGIDAGAFSINDIRMAAGLPAFDDPAFSIPGLLISQENAEQIAVDRGVAPDWMIEKVKQAIETRKNMAILAASSAVAAAANNTDPSKTDGTKPPAGEIKGGAPTKSRRTTTAAVGESE
jgi:hypothetical protein